MRRSLILLLAFFLPLMTNIWGLVTSPHQQAAPRVIIDDSVASDFTALIEEAWVQFMFVFGARSDCFGDITVKADYKLLNRAVYDPKIATITVRVPGRASILKGALFHEWAHHIEFQCEAQKELRSAFMRAQGVPIDTPWQSASGSVFLHSSDWAEIPSEQYAETTIVVIMGERPALTDAPITTEGTRIINAWAHKEDLSCPSGNWTCRAIEFIRSSAIRYFNAKVVVD